MTRLITRRSVIAAGAAAGTLTTLPISMVRLAFGGTREDFSFTYISDSHIQQIKGASFVRNWDMGLKRAVAEANLITPEADFVMFGGDLAQLGKKEELDHGAEMLSHVKGKLHSVMGEHDYYLDLGEYWSKLYGPQWYSFDHKGVHFVVLNSILTTDEWTFHRWPTAEQRMLEMAGLDNPNGSPFMVGEKQRAWLKDDLDKVAKDTPLIVFSHSPLQKIYKGWNFWTDDAEQVQALLQPFKTVNVIYGHVHQIQYNQIGNISFNAVMATAWPWPYPDTYAQAGAHVPVLTVPMNRADPFFERDATGWQMIDVNSGRVTARYQLWDNGERVVGYDPKLGKPVDKKYQEAIVRKAPQLHY
ncbi:metallophosphoesterase [Methylocystis sp. H62]|jgi:3',5'-cyclic AMP phosphodiesterase CpdA|uniref:Serine/threonine protein phosphatase n=1 Tax=Methylocystis rosea TaxID=173366 RepID=A0ABX6EMR4_9HYPH|nr:MULTISPECIES: metallophosphoesterase [Methylocystis]MBG0795528.1 metallophosphoesterase [Methylocystis sp. H62]MDP3068447.1 metallophosphoesterase [Methylocystis sp.]PWB88442.1 serine/threonine protein phosphatase [Methylocystis sp. MitZ-2018]QGM95286.1 serine/threonine protein phosphatase [Methylocystis rosea]